MLSGLNVILGVGAGIAAYKTCELVRLLKKQNACVDVILTEGATHFVTPLTMQTLSQNKVITDTFSVLGKDDEWNVEHVSLAKKADIFVIAPATADLIAKAAAGIADDMLTTTLLATKARVLLCPAMNTAMYDNQATSKNLEILKNRGFYVLDGASGELACGDVGRGRMAEPNDIFSEICRLLLPEQDLKGQKILVSAGGTAEPIDKVRKIVNNSSGKMGIAIAQAACRRGADVTLVLGVHTAKVPACITHIKEVSTTLEMFDAIVPDADKYDCIIMAAAPADYRPEKVFDGKYKGEKMTLELVKNPDIAKAVGTSDYKGTLIVFAAECADLENYALKKMRDKNARLMVANDVTREGAGFGVDTNVVTIYSDDGQKTSYPKMLKSQVADVILDKYLSLIR